MAFKSSPDAEIVELSSTLSSLARARRLMPPSMVQPDSLNGTMIPANTLLGFAKDGRVTSKRAREIVLVHGSGTRGRFRSEGFVLDGIKQGAVEGGTMRRNMRSVATWHGFASVVLSLSIVGCTGDGGNGGGGGDGGTGGTDATQAGVLLNGPVSGVAYETATQSGLTDIDGTFRYLEGETVRFTVGATLLGEVPGMAEVTPFDLADVDVVTGTDNILSFFFGQDYSLDPVMNIAALLQTFDHDGDPTNGIEITPEVATLFDGVSVRFDLRRSEFRRHPPFRNALNAANEQGLLSNHRVPRNDFLAMQRLYVGIAVDPLVFATDVRSVDNDADGTTDTVSMHTLDADSLLTRLERDVGADGMPDSITSWTYDDNANPLRQEIDDDGDGVPDNIVTSFYDVDGNRIRDDRDTDGDGTIDSRNIREYDEVGNLTRRDDDNNADGIPDFTNISMYDARGNLIQQEFDTDGDGTIDQRSVFEYDADDNRVRFERDSDADGTIDSLTVTTYDADGNQLRTERDADADGTPDDIEVRMYDENGNLIRLEDDNDGDGVIDSIRVERYDADGNRLFEGVDSNADGTFNRTSTWEYVNGLLTRLEADTDGDGMPNRIRVQTHDAQGNLTRSEFDADGDGALDSITVHAYDASGNLTRTEIDGDADGVPNSITTQAYDMNHNRILRESDTNADGVVESSVSTTYQATGFAHIYFLLP